LAVNDKYKILAINPGSTSTKIALFENEVEIFSENITHQASELAQFATVNDQYEYRKEMVLSTLRDNGCKLEEIKAFSARGGKMGCIPGGTYLVEQTLLDYINLSIPMNHPCGLAPHIANEIACEQGGTAFMVNPPTVDEFIEVARITGFRDIWRRSGVHALNQKEVAIRYANSLGKSYEELNLIVCHIGGGITVTAHRKGRMIDSSAIMAGDGPMAPTRAGTLPVQDLLEMACSGEYTYKELWTRASRDGGLVDHLGTSDVREVVGRIKDGDRYAALVYEAMMYQIAKYAGSMAVSLDGSVDAIILTGGIARDEYCVSEMRRQLSWIGPIAVIAGEFEMEALAAGALRVLRGEEEAMLFDGRPVWDHKEFLRRYNVTNKQIHK